MHSWNNNWCSKHYVKRKVHQVQRKQTDSHNVMFKMSAFGLNTSWQLWWPLVNCTINASGCTTQLRDVRGLPLPVRSSKPLLCTFPDNFLFLFVSSSYQKIPESVAEHCSLFIPISFKSWLCFLQYQFETFTSYLLKVTWQWRHVYAMNKKVNSLFTESIYSFFQICKSY